jgi:hypothetical protein
MPTDQHERPRGPEDEDQANAPNEGSPGHHPDDEETLPDSETEDHDSEQSFPASDPPANY